MANVGLLNDLAMKARPLYIAFILFAAACSYSDDANDTANLWSTSVSCKHGNFIGAPVAPGDDIELILSIRNASTNTLALDKRSIGITFLESGSLLTRNARSWGSGFMLQHIPSTMFTRADEFIFMKPGASFLRTFNMKVPEELAGDSVTNLSFRATIEATNAGAEYGLNAWTGEIGVGPITIPLQNRDKACSSQYDAKPDPKEACIRNMQMLWEACRSYHLAENVPDDHPVDPTSLNIYFAPHDQNMRCPSGTKRYAPFSHNNGPRCPNSEAHTEALTKPDRQK